MKFEQIKIESVGYHKNTEFLREKYALSLRVVKFLFFGTAESAVEAFTRVVKELISFFD